MAHMEWGLCYFAALLAGAQRAKGLMGLMGFSPVHHALACLKCIKGNPQTGLGA